MAAYNRSNFEEIAAAIGVEVRQIAKHANVFGHRARWYQLAKDRPTRIAPSKTRDKLKELSKNAPPNS
jgi:hypothetical protein